MNNKPLLSLCALPWLFVGLTASAAPSSTDASVEGNTGAAQGLVMPDAMNVWKSGVASTTPPSDSLPLPYHAKVAGVVFFAADTTDFLGDAIADIQSVAQGLQQDRHRQVNLVAGEETQASREYCVALANRRLEVVEAELLKAGVRPSQIHKRNSECARSLLSICLTETCLRDRRRVELQVGK